MLWESDYAGFRRRGIPLVHQVAVPVAGVATLLMDAAERLAHDRGIATLVIAVGLFDEYGLATAHLSGKGVCIAMRGAGGRAWPPGQGLAELRRPFHAVARPRAGRRAMLGVSWDTIRLFLHVLAAAVWVGGQITLAALVPVLRRLGAEIPRAAARRFNQVAWPAFAVLVITGVWNIVAVRSQIHGSYQATLVFKLVAVTVSGVSAALHARAKSKAGLAVFGALAGLSALAASFLGVVLAG